MILVAMLIGILIGIGVTIVGIVLIDDAMNKKR